MANFRTPTDEELAELYLSDAEGLNQYDNAIRNFITTANSNYKITNTDIAERGFISKEYLISILPSLPSSNTQTGLWAWGEGAGGVLGTNNTTSRSSPVQTIAGGSDWKSVHGNSSDSVCGVKKDGTMWLWGNNRSGKLGTNDIVARSSPVQIIGDWEQGATNYANSGGVRKNGQLWIWGRNNVGQLGTNDTVDQSSPVQTITGGSNWKQLAIGYQHAVAIKTDGTLWNWGSNNRGQLGDSTNANRSSPVQTIALGSNWKQCSAGLEHTAAIKNDGTLWLWGRNTNGQLGDGTTTNRSSPVQTIAGGNNWKLVNCGDYHTAAIKTDGTLWLWGAGGQGRLGHGTTQSRSSPVQTIAGGNDWYLVSCGIYHTAAIKKNGSLWTWGSNSSGQLGDGTRTNRSSPIQVIHEFDWVSICATADNTYGVKDDSITAQERTEFRVNDTDTNNIWVRKTYSDAISQPPVVPGSTQFTTAGTHSFSIPHFNTLVIEMWGGGGGGGSVGDNAAVSSGGGASTINSLSLSAGGGARGTRRTTTGNALPTEGGVASGGDTNTNGQSGGSGSGTNKGGDAPNGGSGGAGTSSGNGGNGSAPGGGGGGARQVTPSSMVGSGGGGGAYVKKTYQKSSLTPGVILSIVVGDRGTAGTGGTYTGGNGAVGRVKISWS